MDAVAPRHQTCLMDDSEKRDTIAKITDRLSARYPRASRSLVARVVAEEYDLLDASRIRTYVPTLVEHGARNRLRRELSAESAEI